MSATLLRLGLWIVLIVIAAYVLHETFEGSPIEEYFAPAMMQKALALAVLLIAAGAVLRVFEKGARAVVKNRCTVCRTPVPAGAIYCRAHLRNILHDEDEKTHMTRIRRTP